MKEAREGAIWISGRVTSQPEGITSNKDPEMILYFPVLGKTCVSGVE